MEDFISYYYEFYSFKIIKDDEKYIIRYFNHIYYLYEIYDISKVYKQYHISSSMPFYYSFVFNKFDSIISQYRNRFFVLLNNNNLFDKTVTITSSPYLFLSSFKMMWYYQWIKKSDFLEMKFSSIKGLYSLIDDSFDYYLGLLEMAIYYLRDFCNYVGKGYLQHDKISNSSFYNPLAIKIDLKERDFAEYLKYLFWSNKYKSIDIPDLIYQNRNNYNYSLVIARLLYPNYYFDIFDQIVFFDADICLLEEIVFRTLEFKDYFFLLFIEIQKFSNIKKISF